MNRAVHTHQFPAMGSTIELTLVGGDSHAAQRAFAHAAELAAEWEATFSRFRQTSELSQLNAHSGERVQVSPRLLHGVRAALQARAATCGLFDPTVLPALLAAGYDRSFEHLADLPRDIDVPQPRLAPLRNAQIELSPALRTVRLPAGVMLDLGGIAKGLYADTLAGHLAGWPGGVVSAGGDLRLWGVPPSGDAWQVGIEDPSDPARDIALLSVEAGAVATSGDNRRHWQVGGQRQHHLIDPRTGLPAFSGVRSVTVLAPTAEAAEVVATALFVGGADPVQVARVRYPFLTALVVLVSGEVEVVAGTIGDGADASADIAA